MNSKRSSLVKPTINTPFRIDFDWWKKHDRDWRVYLRSFLCPEHQETYETLEDGEFIDWIDPETAEVTQVDGLQHILITHCAKQEDFLTSKTAVVEAVFRIFLSNGNKALTPEQLAEKVNRPAKTILKTFSGFRVYKGIRPISQ